MGKKIDLVQTVIQKIMGRGIVLKMHLRLLHVQVQLHVIMAIMVIVNICAGIYSLNVNHATKCKLCN